MLRRWWGRTPVGRAVLVPLVVAGGMSLAAPAQGAAKCHVCMSLGRVPTARA